MIVRSTALLALWARAVSVSVVTTGTMALSATATGYARATGSFLTDGFVPGMEITPVGFATNTVDLITGVAALTLTTANGRAVEASAGSRSITVKLPAVQATELKDTTKLALRWRVEEEFIPGPKTLMGQKNGGLVRQQGLYLLKLFAPERYGPLAMCAMTDALETLFAPGTYIVGGNPSLAVRTDSSVYSGQIIPQGDGNARCLVTVPWESYWINQIAA